MSGKGKRKVVEKSTKPVKSSEAKVVKSMMPTSSFVEDLYTVEMNEAERGACGVQAFTPVDGALSAHCYFMTDCPLPEPVDSVDDSILEPGMREAFAAADHLTEAQIDLYRGLRDYRDVLCATRTHVNGADLRSLTVLHALNHAIACVPDLRSILTCAYGILA
jgi:hypothetical protein